MTNRITRRSLVQGIAAAGALGALSQHAQAEGFTNVTFALDWYANANHAGIFMAQANGLFEQAGLNVDIFVPADPTTVLQTVGAGRDTFGVTYQNDVLQAREKGVPVKSIAAIVQHPLNSLMVLESSDILSPADLKGKTVAMAGVPSDEAYLKTILASGGLSMNDVETVNVGFDLMPALLSGRADAVIGVYWTHETILAEHEGHPVRYFRIEEFGVPDYYELVIVASDDTIASRPEVVTAFLDALRQGYMAADADHAKALEVLTQDNPELVQDVEAEGLELLAPMWTDGGTVEWGTQTSERWDSYTAWAQSEGLIDASVVADDAWADLFSGSEATPVATPN